MPKKAAKKSLGKAFDISTVFDSIVVKLRVLMTNTNPKKTKTRKMLKT